MSDSKYISKNTAAIFLFVFSTMAFIGTTCASVCLLVTDSIFLYLYLSLPFLFMQMICIALLQLIKKSFHFAYWALFAIAALSVLDILLIIGTTFMQFFVDSIGGAGLGDGLAFGIKDLLFLIFYGACFMNLRDAAKFMESPDNPCNRNAALKEAKTSATDQTQPPASESK